jgi:TolA-binding protein
MKKIFVVVVAVFLCGVVSGSWGGDKEPVEPKSSVLAGDVEQKAKETGEAATQYAEQKKSEYQQKVETELREFNKKLDEMKEKAADLKGHARTEFDRIMKELREKQGAAARELEALKAKSGRAWEDLKGQTDEAVQDLKQAYDKAVSRFK